MRQYRKKRDFRKTPEPPPKKAARKPGQTVFVVHRHEATRLHYDLRLEAKGVLKSWAVPRGFSYVPKEKRLAVRTEDHPLEYERFEGVIPKGQYGAGTMTIWDHGPYEVLNTEGAERAIAAGKLEVRLFGKRLRGEWHLVKTRLEKDGWLLFKASDGYARAEQDSPYPFSIDLGKARKRGLPRKLAPMKAGRQVPPFSDPGWLFEMEFRGLRLFAVKKGLSVQLVEASSGKKLPGKLEEVSRVLEQARAEKAVFDGVLVALDGQQRPCRQALEERLQGKREAPLFLYVFDLLYYDEWHLGKLSLIERKRLLSALLPRGEVVLYVDHVLGEGEKLAEVVSRTGLPAVIAKETSSAYRAGPSSSWRKIEVEQREGRAHKDILQLLRPSRRGKSRHGRVRFSNRHKVFWPEQGYTKGDLIDYYERVAEYLLPYLHDRPLHLHRFPDGITGKSFYHHNAPGHLPDWVATESIASTHEKRPIRYIICNDRETLLYLANLGSIDLHPWLSRRGRLDVPDWLILDLDPNGSSFTRVVKVARAIGKLLRGIGLRPYLKTSGKSGLHISLPLLSRYTYEEARMFAEGIARQVAREHPEVSTVERSLAERRGRVYIDFLQIRRGQTVVPPYVPRPVPAASVSTPLDWDELSSDLEPARLDMETIPGRLAQLGDLYHPTLSDRQDLLPAIEAFQKLFT